MKTARRRGDGPAAPDGADVTLVTARCDTMRALLRRPNVSFSSCRGALSGDSFFYQGLPALHFGQHFRRAGTSFEVA